VKNLKDLQETKCGKWLKQVSQIRKTLVLGFKKWVLTRLVLFALLPPPFTGALEIGSLLKNQRWLFL